MRAMRDFTSDDLAELQGWLQRCIRYDGPYTLASGRQSAYYYDGRGATLDPVSAWLIGRALVDPLLDAGAEAVGGLEVGAIPIADAAALAAHVTRGVRIPTFIVRKERKSHGITSQVAMANQPDGSALLRPGRRVAVVDDVITTGGSIQKAVDVVRELGCDVGVAVALVERHESGGAALRGQGFPVKRLFYTDDAGKLYVDAEFAARVTAPAAR
jgi:orotate phosphoribosyltransferase